MNSYIRRTCTWIMMLLLVHSLAQVPAFAQAAPESSATNPLAAHIEKWLSDLEKDENSIGMQAGISVYDLTDKTVLYQHHANRNYVPASNMKLFTTVAGLDKLGPDYQWKTEVFVSGRLSAGGVLNGDLVLKGYGDPTLSVEDLQSIAAALKEKGINHVNGNLLLDESYFDETRLGPGWMWDDEPFGYSAQISALAVHKNFVTVKLTPAKTAAAAPAITIEPSTTYVKVTNQVQTVEGGKSEISVERPRGKNEIILTGTIGTHAAPYEEDVTMEDPALFAGEVWKQQLLAQGIKIQPKAELKKTVVHDGVPFHTHLSKPLGEVIVELNKESDNFYAEMLFKTLGATQRGKGSFEAGSEAVADVLKRAGVETGYRQVDGSGLSRLDLITPEQMVKLLTFVQEQDFREALEKSLPIAGVDGTLKSRMIGTPAQNKVMAKTGSMGGVNSLSGYVTAKNGNKLAFSILINGIYKSKYASSLQDSIAVLLASYPDIQTPDGFVPKQPEAYKLSVLLDPVLDREGAIAAGVLVKSLDDSGEEAVWYEHEADSLLTPASNLKLLTTAAALQELGPDYVFKTEVFGSTALPTSGVLNGNLYLKGFGDPTLHTEDALQVQEGVSVEKIASWVKEQGIKRINGNLVMDESFFDQQRLGLGWAWDDESYDYNPTLGALALNRGTVMVEYQPGTEEGAEVKLNLLPKTSYVKVINEAKTVAAGEENTLAIVRDRGTNTIRVTGNLPIDHAGDYERVPVEDPAQYLGTVLQEALRKEGVSFSANSAVLVQNVPNTAFKWTEFHSLPLTAIVTYLNKNSDNFYAEMLLKTLGAVKKGEGSASAGAQVVQETVKALGGTTNFDMVDGSGLTRYNLISARHVVEVLEGMARQPGFDAYEKSLPIAGVDGTLKNRFQGTAAQNNLHGKTGSMTGVNSLSGYITTKGGDKLVVSIILNGYTESSSALTKLQDDIIHILASYE